MVNFELCVGDMFIDPTTETCLVYKGVFPATDTLVFEAEYAEGFKANIALDAHEVREAYITGRFQEVPGARHVQELGS